MENINIDIANYVPLADSSYFPLPPELRNSMKGLINLKNKDIKFFKCVMLDFLILKIKILIELKTG